MDNNELIKSSRERFDKILHTDHYKIIHSDADQLETLLGLFEFKKNKSYLDIGTGNGYIAFEIAKKNKDINVFGLDIAINSIIKNNLITEQEKIKNLKFYSYDGIDFPFENKMFYGCISRYAFHHFPDINKTLTELSRIIENQGFFILSDPLAYNEDNNNFIDKFQSVLKDGHIHFYERKEIEDLFKKYDFIIEKEFYSSIRYPREINENYQILINNTTKEILDKYQIEIKGDKVFIRVKVMNILFRNTGNKI